MNDEWKGVLDWLLNQAGVVVAMGIGIKGLWGRLKQADAERMSIEAKRDAEIKYARDRDLQVAQILQAVSEAQKECARALQNVRDREDDHHQSLQLQISRLAEEIKVHVSSTSQTSCRAKP